MTGELPVSWPLMRLVKCLRSQNRWSRQRVRSGRLCLRTEKRPGDYLTSVAFMPLWYVLYR